MPTAEFYEEEEEEELDKLNKDSEVDIEDIKEFPCQSKEKPNTNG